MMQASLSESIKDHAVILVNAGSSDPLIREKVRNGLKRPHFGLLSLTACLRMHGYRVLLLDLVNEELTLNAIIRRIRSFSPSPLAIGLSSYTENFFLLRNLISLKTFFPGTSLIAGGPHVSSQPEEALNLGLDFVVAGEGEGVLITLLEHIKNPEGLPPEKVPGIIFFSDGTIHRAAPASRIRHLDAIPFTTEAATCDRRGVLFLLTSRGCPGKCIFCASGSFFGRAYRMVSTETIVSMVSLARHLSPRLNHVDFMDDTFILNRKRLDRLFEIIRTIGIEIDWDARCRIDQLGDELIRSLRKHGCISLHIGVESADQEILDAIGKNVRIDAFFSGLAKLIEAGITPRCSFMIGHHVDTLESIERTLILADAIDSNNLGTVAIGVSTPFPGTPLAKRAEELGLQIYHRRWRSYTLTKPVYSTRNFSLSDIRRAMHLFQQNRPAIRSGPFLSGKPQTEYRERISNWVRDVLQTLKKAPPPREKSPLGNRNSHSTTPI